MAKQKRYTMTMAPDLMDRIGLYADEMHISRSAAIAVMCSQVLEQRKSMDAIGQFMALIQQGKIDPAAPVPPELLPVEQLGGRG